MASARGLSTGQFSARPIDSTTAAPGSATAGDFDQDGDLDVLAGSIASVSLHTSLLPDDTDNDRLSDAAEVCISGTEVQLFDSDGDGEGDGIELWNLTDPFNPADP